MKSLSRAAVIAAVRKTSLTVAVVGENGDGAVVLTTCTVLFL